MASDVNNLTSSQVRSLVSIGLGSSSPASQRSEIDCVEAALRNADRSVLQQALSDLQSLVIQPGDGPLSFQRMAGVDAGVLEELRGKTILEALTSPDTTPAAYAALDRYGELLSGECFSQTTRLTGALIRVVCRVGASRTSGRTKVDGELRELMGALASSDSLVDAIRELADES